MSELRNLPVISDEIAEAARAVARVIWPNEEESLDYLIVMSDDSGYVDIFVDNELKERVVHETIVMRLGYSKAADILFVRMPPRTKIKGMDIGQDFYGQDVCPCCHKPLANPPQYSLDAEAGGKLPGEEK